MNNPKKILFAPLDWGLGHASRCIPLIKECLALGHQVIIAGNHTISALLRPEFPQLQFLELKGYEVKYAKQKWALPFLMMKQIPSILSVMRFERKWLDNVVTDWAIDMVISDNRYGLQNDKVACVFITHQVQIRIPQSTFLQTIVNRLNHRYLKKFDVCLVPDYEHDNMSGVLSGKGPLTNIRYIGNLSRFTPQPPQEKKYDVLLLLSGPEPQRSLLEQKLIEALRQSPLKSLVVRGKPGSSEYLQDSSSMTVKNHLHADELQQAICLSDRVICRAGYSTIMDLIKLNKRAILIPTPGQTEQEYLGHYLMEKKWFVCCPQRDITLDNLIENYVKFSFSPFPDWDMTRYKSEIGKVLSIM